MNDQVERRRAAVTIIGLGVVGLLIFVVAQFINGWTSTEEAAGGAGGVRDDQQYTTGYFSSRSKRRPNKVQSRPSFTSELEMAEDEPQLKALHLRAGEFVRANDRSGAISGARSLFIWFYSPMSDADVPLVSYSHGNKSIWALTAKGGSGRLCFSAFSREGREIGSVKAKGGNSRDNEWHCVGFVRQDDGSLRLYMDGVPLLSHTEGSATPQLGSDTSLLMVGAKYHDGRVVSSPDHTGVSNLTIWSGKLDDIKVTALSQQHFMTNPMQLITDRARSLISWMPLWDSNKVNVKDVRGGITNAKFTHQDSSRPDEEPRGLKPGLKGFDKSVREITDDQFEKMGGEVGGVQRKKLPPPQ